MSGSRRVAYMLCPLGSRHMDRSKLYWARGFILSTTCCSFTSLVALTASVLFPNIVATWDCLTAVSIVLFGGLLITAAVVFIHKYHYEARTAPLTPAPRVRFPTRPPVPDPTIDDMVT